MLIGHQGGRGGSLYDLYAVVHHLGALSSGHYVASVKSPSASKWHYFNDNQVLRTASITREPLAIYGCAIGLQSCMFLLFLVCHVWIEMHVVPEPTILDRYTFAIRVSKGHNACASRGYFQDIPEFSESQDFNVNLNQL